VTPELVERLLIALGDGDAVDDRRPEIFGFAIDEFRDRARLGLEPLHASIGVVERCARGFQFLPRGDMAGFARLRRGFGLRKMLLRSLHDARELGEVAEAAGFLRELVFFIADARDLLIEPRQPILMAANAGFELPALGGEISQRRGQFGKQPLRIGQRRFGVRHTFIDAAALLDARFDLVL
jgi:hypothetical protein